jgi:predicted transcriptional regulator
MRRARFRYVVSAWRDMLITEGLTHADVSRAAAVTERHVANIVAGDTTHARYKTIKKIREGLIRRGIKKAKVDKLFDED